MTAEALVLGLATLAVAALFTSVLTWLALPAVDAASRRLAPAAATRVWRAAVFAPWLVGFATLGAVFGLVPDHCIAHGAHHPHLCLEHASWPALGVALIALGIAVRVTVSLLAAALRAWRSSRVVCALEAASAPATPDGTRRIPGTQPWAVAAGIFRPRVYVSEALAADADAPIVLAHEKVHVQGRDALWQWITSIATMLHLPGVGRAIARRMSVSQEMAADEGAGLIIGERARVAEALVRLARSAGSTPLGVAFGTAALEARVQSLLSESRDLSRLRDAPARWILSAAILVAAFIALGAEGLHHALETFFGHLA